MTGVAHRIAVGLTLALLVAVASAQQLRDPTRPPGGAAAPKADTRAGPRKQSAIVLQTILIGNDLSGNVYTNPHEGQALAFGMFVVLAAMMLFYVPMQRRASRWAR